MGQRIDYSESFYRRHAQRYAEVSHKYIQSVYSNVSHPALRGDADVMERMLELAPVGSRGLDAGCGAGARDVFLFWQAGYDIYGVDAIKENIEEARRLHPEIARRVSVADLREPIDHPDASFDFLICNAVIQHIEPDIVMGRTLPEFARVLRPGGVLQLVFKVGKGIATLYGRDYASDRSFHLYGADEVQEQLDTLGLRVIPAEDGKLGGVMYFADTKPANHCLLYARKSG